MAVKKKTKTSVSSEPKTMEELLAKHGFAGKIYSRGDTVKAKVVEKTGKTLVLDIGGKSEGLVAEKAFLESKSFIKGLEIGDEVTAKVIVPETPDGFVILSLRHASQDFVWGKLEKLMEKKGNLSVQVRSVNPAGVIVEVFSLTGFIPTSHLGKEALKNIDSSIGQTLQVKLVELGREANKIVLSEKAVSESDKLEAEKEAIGNVKEGDVFEGEVTTVTDFGCFVRLVVPDKKKKIKTELEGLVHISELSWDRVGKPSDLVKEGDKVKVGVMGVRNGKLSLSMKQTGKDPWSQAEEKYQPEQKAKGKVVRTSDFGVFVQLEPGIEGLIHMTKIPPGKKLRKGDEVGVYVEEVDGKAKKISLGLVLTEKPVGYK